MLAGHADYATTEKYHAHLTPDGNEEALRRLRFNQHIATAGAAEVEFA